MCWDFLETHSLICSGLFDWEKDGYGEKSTVHPCVCLKGSCSTNVPSASDVLSLPP